MPLQNDVKLVQMNPHCWLQIWTKISWDEHWGSGTGVSDHRRCPKSWDSTMSTSYGLCRDIAIGPVITSIATGATTSKRERSRAMTALHSPWIPRLPCIAGRSTLRTWDVHHANKIMMPFLWATVRLPSTVNRNSTKEEGSRTSELR